MSKPMADEPEEYAPTVSFYFNKDSKKATKAPKNFDDLQIDENIKVTVSGKVRSIRHDSNCRSFEVTTDKVKLVTSDSKPMGVGDGMAAITKERTS